MIQFNLLPAVKINYLKAKRLRRTISLVSTIIIGVCVLVSVVLYSIVVGLQQNQLSNLDKSIKSVVSDIKSTQDINKILTIQNQLKRIDALHSSKPEVMRVFTYITQLTTKSVSLQAFNVDFETSKIDVQGQATSIEEMNKYVDTLKFTTIDSTGSPDLKGKNAFSQVVLSSYSINDKGAGFSVSFNYLKEIFDSSKTDLKLTVPKITSTRSETERPSDLFKINLTPTSEE